MCVFVCVEGMGRFRRSSGYLHLSMQSFSKWRMLCVAVVRLCVTAAEWKHTPWRRIQNRGERIRETDRRVNTEWQSRQWWERKRHSLRFGDGVGGGNKTKAPPFPAEMWNVAVFFFSLHTLWKEGVEWKYDSANKRYNWTFLVYCIIPPGVCGKLILFILSCLL